MIYTIKVKDYDSMQNITIGLAKNGYFVTTNNVTDENYKSHWEIKYCESSEINKIPDNNGNDCWDGDYISSMEIHNNDNTEGVKCKILPDEKPSVENKEKPLVYNKAESLVDNKEEPVSFDEKEKPLIDNEKEVIDPNPYGLVPRHNAPDILINT